MLIRACTFNRSNLVYLSDNYVANISILTSGLLSVHEY